MKRAAAIGALITIALGCSSDSDDDSLTPDAVSNESTGQPPSDDAGSPELSSGRTSETTEQHDNGQDSTSQSTPVPCQDKSPAAHAQVGTVNTIVVPLNSDAFDGAVGSDPTAACPGDVVSFTITVENVSDRAEVFSAGRGLIFFSGGMAKWSMADLGELDAELVAGGRLEQIVSGIIPPVPPGTYRVGPEGASFFGEIVILDPHGGE